MNAPTSEIWRAYVVEPAGWMLIHSIWQLACLGAILAFGVRVSRNKSADVRYALSAFILGWMVVMPAATFWGSIPASQTQPLQVVAPDDGLISDDNARPQSLRRQLGEIEGNVASARPESSTASARETSAEQRSTWRNTLHLAFPWFVAIWAVGVVTLSLWNIGGWIALQRLIRLGACPAGANLQAAVGQLAERLKLKASITVVESVVVRIPSVVGWLRPTILLPSALVTGLSPEQLEAILAHELAHIRRNDYLANLLQTVAETLLFYHPAIWYASHRIRIEREYCADQMAADICGDRARYAEALTTVEENVASLASLAVAFGGGSLANRIRRVLGLTTNDAGRTGSWLCGAACSIGLLIVLVTAPALHASMQLAAAPRVEMNRVWADADTYASGSISPDGRFLSYVNWVSGDVGVYDLQDRIRRELTDEGSWGLPNQYAETPVWSPDSRRIAYTWLIDEKPEIRIVPLAGGDPETVYRPGQGGWVYARDWSPDGKNILANARAASGEKSVVLISITGEADPQELTNFPEREGDLQFSPDGKVIAFVRHSSETGRDIYFYDLAAGEVSAIVQHPVDDYAPRFTADGKWLTFVSTRDGTAAVWAAPLKDKQVSGEPMLASPMAPGGRTLGIADQGTYYFGKSKSSSDIFVVDYDPAAGKASSPRRLVNTFEGRNLNPAWSDDGNRLVYYSTRPSPLGGVHRVPIIRDWRVNAANFEVTMHIDNASRMNFPASGLAWKPGSNAFYLSTIVRTGDPLGPEVWLLECDVESGRTTRIDAAREVSPALAVSPSGDAVYRLQWTGNQTIVRRRRLADGVTTTVATIDDVLLRAAMSPDGKSLALHSLKSLWSLEIEGGRANMIFQLDDSSQAIPRGIDWTADSQKIIFVLDGSESPKLSSLMQVALTGGPPQPLGVSLPEIWGVRVHPGGRQIAFTGRRDAHRAEVWTVKNSLLTGANQ